MSALPQLRVMGPWTTGEPLVVALRGPTLADAAVRAHCIDALRTFVSAAERGAFAVAAPSVAKVIVKPITALDDRLELVMVGQAIGLRAFQVLRNLVADRDDGPTGVNEVTVAPMWPGADVASLVLMPPPDEDDDLNQYPAVAAEAAIDLVWEPVGGSWVRRCMVEYADPPEPEEVDALSDWIEPWFEMLEGGGYAPPAGLPGEVVNSRGGTAQFDVYSIELSVMRFEASEAAWAGLINMIAARDAGQRRIVRLTFD